MSRDNVHIRRATEADRPEIISVCQQSLGWKPNDPNEAFFAWKHDENAFGQSPMWVATEASGEIVGVRVFMRWRFTDPSGPPMEMVRAVDTATLPSAQGRGVFKRLTLGAIPDLRDMGTAAVFNTPNEKSRPGYLKMGWNDVGRVPLAVRVRTVSSVKRVLGANTAAEMWSIHTKSGIAATEAFTSEHEWTQLLSSREPSSGISTDRSLDFLKWRYSFEPLHYRVLPIKDSLENGAIIFRVRQRGSAIEVAVCDIISPNHSGIGRALGGILKETQADYLVTTATVNSAAHLCVPVPQLGPRLTWRSIVRTGTPRLRDFNLAIGDVELF